MNREMIFLFGIVLSLVAAAMLGMWGYNNNLKATQYEQTLKTTDLKFLYEEYGNQLAREVEKERKGLNEKVTALSESESQLKARLEQLEGSLLTQKELAKEHKSMSTARSEEISEQQKAIRELKQKISALQEELTQPNEELRRVKEDLNGEKLARQKAMEEARREQTIRAAASEASKKEQAALKNKIDTLQKALGEFQNLQARREAGKKDQTDGKVLEVDIDRNIAVIDLGKVNRIIRGMRFNVIRWRRNQWQRMGTLEVTKVFPSTCMAMIVNEVKERMVCPLTGYVGQAGMRFSPFAATGENQDKVVELIRMGVDEAVSMKKHDPILKGDFISNPFYSRDKILNFTIAGEPTEYSHEELGTLIRKYGGKIQSSVTVETDFLVLCRIPSELIPAKKALYETTMAAQEQANQYGIPIMREIELLNFLKQ